MTRTSRSTLVLTALLVAPLVAVAQPAAAAEGDLTQVGRPPAACITETGNAEVCADGRGLEGALRTATSKDGKSVYVASQVDDAIVVLSRNATTGALTQLAGTAGCFSDTGSDGCADGTGLDGPSGVAVSADGKFVYASASNSGAVTTFARNTTTGALSQLSGTAGCISATGAGGCGAGSALENAAAVTVTADGTSVYVGANNSDGVSAFARNATTGVLTQLAGSAGCVTESGTGGCADGRGLDGVLSVTASADGKSVYVGAEQSHSVAVFARKTTTTGGNRGALTQLSGDAGCVSDTGADGCTLGRELFFTKTVVVSPDGKSVYVSSGDGVAEFSRQTSTTSGTQGKLTQLAGTAGCLTETGAGGCTDGTVVNGSDSIAISPDGKTVHITAGDAVANYVRQVTTGSTLGKLTPLSGSAACISETGAGGCIDGVGLSTAIGVSISADGKFVHVGSFVGGVAVLSRQTTTTGGTLGKLTSAGIPPTACVSEDGNGGICTDAHSLEAAASTAVSKDGKSVYVASENADAVTVFARNATTGALTQLADSAGCISETGAGDCVNGAGLVGARSVAVSNDGRSVYVVSGGSDAIAVFARNTTSGALTQLGTGACLSETGAGVCGDAVALDGPKSVGVSADGKSVYVASDVSDAVAVFARQSTTTGGTQGKLTQLAGTAACISETGADGCADGAALDGSNSVIVSADGKSVYVTASASDAVTSFARQTTTTGGTQGTLTPLTGTAACTSDLGTDGCSDGDALDGPSAVTISRDGTSVYVTSAESDSVSVFARQTGTTLGNQGKLTQLDGTAACISDTGAGECADGVALNGPSSITVSYDGASVYVTSAESDSVSVFARQTTTTSGNRGKLTQASGTAACIAESTTDGCADGVALDGAASVVVGNTSSGSTPTTKSVYVASPSSNAVAVFSRAP